MGLTPRDDLCFEADYCFHVCTSFHFQIPQTWSFVQPACVASLLLQNSSSVLKWAVDRRKRPMTSFAFCLLVCRSNFCRLIRASARRWVGKGDPAARESLPIGSPKSRRQWQPANTRRWAKGVLARLVETSHSPTEIHLIQCCLCGLCRQACTREIFRQRGLYC